MHRMWVVAALMLGGCSEQPPACITVDTTCAPLYLPSFDNVYATTVSRSCGTSKGSCHSSSGESGLSFTDPQATYDKLLSGLVVPGDPGCSELIVRTSSPGKDYQMPKGSSLIASERCALIQWVLVGAPGPGQPLAGAAR